MFQLEVSDGVARSLGYFGESRPQMRGRSHRQSSELFWGLQQMDLELPHWRRAMTTHYYPRNLQALTSKLSCQFLSAN